MSQTPNLNPIVNIPPSLSPSDVEKSALHRAGTFYAAGAYTLWGLFPIYWKWLTAFQATELIAHRVLWAFLFYWLLATRLGGSAREWISLLRSRATFIPIATASLLLTANWFLYVWAVNSGHIVEASLGYFITPLLNVLTGRLVLKERLSNLRWCAVFFAAAGVFLLTIQSERFPWISISLALTFSLYGLIRKRLTANVFQASTAETSIVLVPAIAVIIWQRWFAGSTHEATHVEMALIAGSGIVTGLPLIWFAQAARRLPLSILGFFQYIAPTLQFLLGIFVYGEVFTTAKLQAFLLIWIALAIFAWGSIRESRKSA